MKAIVVHEHGGPETLGYEDVPAPTAGPGQILVRVEAVGVNFIDVYYRMGLYKAAMPLTPGQEIAGTVEAVGAGVADLRAGDRVAYQGGNGGYAEMIAIPAERAVQLPQGLTCKKAAAVMLQGMTAHYLACTTYPLKPGDTCLVHAAAGGVGLLLCQIAKRRGARVFGTVSTAEKAELARLSGADEVIRYDEKDFETEVKRLTDDKGVQVVYDSVGKTTFDKSLRCLVRRGMMVLFGQSSGPVPPFEPQILNQRGSLFLTRPKLGDYSAARGELLERAGEVFGWADEGTLSVRVDRELPLAQAAEAHRLLESRATSGKVLLIPGKERVKLDGNRLRLSATDLANHLACRHLTALDRAAAERRIEPPHWKDEALEVLKERGFKHETAYLEHLESHGRSVFRIEGDDLASAFERTRQAMREGRDVIVQASLTKDRWHGRADVLLRAPGRTALGDWGYEVVDTKLARETRAGTMLQLCVYSDIVAELQSSWPERMHVVTPGTAFEPESYKVRDYLAYFRLVRRRLEAAVDGVPEDDTSYPDPVPHCDVCRWWLHCDRERRADDHLSLVAGITRLHRRELADWDVETLEALARLPLPLERAPRRGSRDGIVRVREQARIQHQGRNEGRPVHELLERGPDLGLARLPEPSPGDVFLDLEGDPFVEDGGLEFLFGVAYLEDGAVRYRAPWATRRADERRAFEDTIDFIVERWRRFPDLHVYHYGDYEPSALKRLMGRHGTREEEIDRLLRGLRFVDLHKVVKQALRASVEKYSIKDLEAFYGFERSIALDRSGPVLRAVQFALERGGDVDLDAEQCRIVEAYNRDDCVSAARLRDWLESLRAACVAQGEAIARPVAPDDAPSEALDEKTQRRRALAARLLEGVPEERAQRDAAQQGRWLVAQLLEFHRREEKSDWWKFFELSDASSEELMEEQDAIGGLSFTGRVETIKRSVVDRYEFPRQEVRLRADDEVSAAGIQKFGKIVAIDAADRWVTIKKGPSRAEEHPAGIFCHGVVPSAVIADSIERLATWVLDHGIDSPGDHRAARDLLLNLAPRLKPWAWGPSLDDATDPTPQLSLDLAGAPRVDRGREPAGTSVAVDTRVAADAQPLGPALCRAGEEPSEAAVRLVLVLDGGVLPIQGPPGAGKTHTGARMICALVHAGRKVGVTANSHRVITHLLEAVIEAAAELGVEVTCGQKPGETPPSNPGIVVYSDNEKMLRAVRDGQIDVAGGTSWLWSREDFHDAVNVLVVDEAGQLSLANVLGVAQAARDLVLLGDPQQLDQPAKGSHPEGAQVSALGHVLQAHETILPDRGLFLERTWRLHPTLCAFTSEAFYDGRLHSRDGLEVQALEGPTPFAGSGLWFVPVAHDGNQNASAEEVEAVASLLAELTAPGVTWTDRHGARRSLTHDDVLIVAPYNAQVSDLKDRLPHARVGTVDKFQGQEAAVVIYSMTSSTPEDAPRGMEFLYSLNRLNVATSRARCASILVGSPRLFEPECQAPKHMRLANAFCRYREMAKVVER